MPEPVAAFSVGWVPDVRRGQPPPLLAAQLETPFVGRQAELAGVTRAWESIADGGRRPVTSGENGTLVVWDLEPATWADTACRMAARDLTLQERIRYLAGEPARSSCATS